jgi:hypothetical protein
MTDHQANIFVTSVGNISNRFAAYGTGDIMDISLLKLCFKYACYASDYESLQKIDRIVSELQMKNPDICMDYSNGGFFASGEASGDTSGGTPGQSPSINTAPTVSVNTVDIIGEADGYAFILADFTVDFADAEGHGPGKIVIKSLPTNPLLYNGGAVLIGQIVATPFRFI